MALAMLVCAAGWAASTAMACHSEIDASINCNGVVSYTATAWNGSDATTASRTNSDVRVWASTDGGRTFSQVGSGHFGRDNGFTFSGTFSAGSASSVVVKVQEVAKWGNGDSPADARVVDLSKQGCSSTPPPATCPSQGMVQANGPITIANGVATVRFTVASGCKDIQLSLVSYKAASATFSEQTAGQQQLYDARTGIFSAGTYTLTVAVPNCYYQVDFVYGMPIEHLGPAGTNNFYGKQGRLISSANGGTSSCTSTNTPPTTTDTPPPTTNTPPPAQTPAPAVAVTKLQRVGSVGDYTSAPIAATVGQTIAYQINVVNTGNVMLTVTLQDARCDAGTVAPATGQGVGPTSTVTFTCTHLLTAADVGSFVNTAIGTGTAGNGQQVTGTATVTAQVTAATATSGVLGTTKTVTTTTVTKKVAKKAVAKKAAAKKKTVAKKVKAKPKKVTKQAKPAKPVVVGAHFTG